MYKYFVNNLEVFPINNGAGIFKYEKRNDGGLIFDKAFDQELDFKYNDINFNFKNQERLDKCKELDFRIEEKCSGSWIISWQGFFTMAECGMDDDRCIATVKPRMREFIITDVEVNIFDDPIKVDEGGVIGVIGPTPSPGTGLSIFPNCRYFDNFLFFVAKKSNPKIKSVKSNFFQINPDGPFYMPGVTNHYTKMVVSSLSDIAYPIPSNPGRRELITFGDLMSDLKTIFCVLWAIDSNYNLRVEHETYFEGVQGLDLTQSKYSEHMKGFNKYTYSLGDYVKKENWKIYNHAEVVSLVYNGLSDITKTNAEKNYGTSKIATDYRKLVWGISGGGGTGSTDDGIMLLATDGGTGAGDWRILIDGLQNYTLTPNYLVPAFHFYNRPSLTAIYQAYLNKECFRVGGVILQSIKPTKTQTEIKFPLCCNDTFRVQDRIKTAMGEGFVDKAELDMKTNILKMTLKYKIDNCKNIQPNEIDGLDLWLKYNDVIVDNPSLPTGSVSYVQQWNDSSGKGRHAVQANQDDKPLFYTNQPEGSPVFFFNSYSVPVSTPVLDYGMNLKTPAFQLFPNKRGTIFIVFNTGTPSFPTNLQQSSGSSPGAVLSTQDGGADVYFDYSFDDNGQPASVAEGVNYPTIPSIGGVNTLMVLRRSGDISIDTSWQTIPAFNNPAVISNNQPDSNQLVIGYNGNVAYFSTVWPVISEIIVYDRDLTEQEIEDIQFYLIKKKLLTL